MANVTRCRVGRHQYELVSSIGAGLQRHKCAMCGSVMIDLTDEGGDLAAAGLFSPRRATVFSVRPTTDDTAEGFGRPRARR